MPRKSPVTIADVRRAVNNVGLQRILGKIDRAGNAGRLSATQEIELRLKAYGLKKRNAAPTKRAR